jgi:hypothetical protein
MSSRTTSWVDVSARKRAQNRKLGLNNRRIMKSLLDALNRKLLALLRVVRLVDQHVVGLHGQAPDAVAGDGLWKKTLDLPQL